MVEKSASHVEWETRLGRMAEAASAWRELTSGEQLAVEEGSPLAGDDARFPELRVSSQAGYSIAVATEHLDFALSSMRATATLYPTSYMTVFRTALLCASHAHWVLSPPSRIKRLERALRVTADDLRSQLAMTRQAYASSPGAEEAKRELEERLGERQSRLQDIGKQLGMTEDLRKAVLKNTMIVEEVGKEVHRDDDLTAGGVNMVWRSGSSAAHGGRSFALLRMDNASRFTAADGSSYVRLGGDLENDIGPAAAAASMALSAAFDLFKVRRTKHR